ncbi:hypothetical protein INT47_003180 [Mucor saturninus]|uniref:Uncharacterized protein n=1 Tax=Mucor saturninus TaxID=64648 RepID=A0A8H7UYY3_9FUNG|nr:hypothetical protein INT47_003180 [Mucor saturninus]
MFFGLLSIFCWLNAQVPQMMDNYKSGSADGLSLYLLYFWLAGDLGNMFSCVLNHQLPFQTYLAMYFVSTDLILLYQYFYFGKGDQVVKEALMTMVESHDEETSLVMTKTREDILTVSQYGSTDKSKTTTALMGLLLFGCKIGLGSTLTTTTMTTQKGGDALGLESPVTAGWLLAWMCTTFYLVSRIPQIHKNHKRHSTQGLSLWLFSFAVSGNMTYAISILLHPGHTRKSLFESLPYVAGSFGTLFLDTIIFGQFMYYRNSTKHEVTHTLSRVPTTQ